ncbi:MAG: PIN domain-containing protein [Deltaproteobacteria bacterium]|nr:PIN domain-containing protein [Deltaproteobacteria bacterium]
MIAVDTSTLVDFFAGKKGDDIDQLREGFRLGIIILPPIVLSEILSDPQLPAEIEDRILKLPSLEIKPGFWERVGKLRRILFKKKLKPKLADTLIAQFCLDHSLPLLTRDKDFQNFQRFGSLVIKI